MSTTRPTATRSLAPVVALRPRSLTRRADALRAHVDVRRAAGLPHEQLFLDVIDETLSRTRGVQAEDLDVWERLLALVEEHEDISHTLPACAAAANLVGLALFGDVEELAALSGLADELGHDRLARLQHRYGTALETDARLPVTTAAMRRMLVPGLVRRLASHPGTAPRSGTIDDTCLRAAHALLVQGVDRAWTVPLLDSVEELVDIAAHGTVHEWRHHVAMIMADPWSPYASRIVELADQAGPSHAVAVFRSVVDLCRAQDRGHRVPGHVHHATRRSRYPGGRAAP
ncbi:hypothetical protein FHP29_04255 [Nocardioides albidus]|uniref:Uncharacterized protein n=1 Tax=Nocardioides albidus TaxID=1517589 RepID=A0A5C4WDE2_9ACTN|nr:hypothetical protein [Nocardioides albidus]TNM46141.1 hypothetical protein FHP29_04255 [Nocardioides albidus]